jgi:Peptidase family S41
MLHDSASGDLPANSSADGSVGELLSSLRRWIPELLADSDRADRLVAACQNAAPEATVVVSAAVCRSIERAAQAHSRHFSLFFEESGQLVPDTDSPGWPPPDFVAIKGRAAFVSEVSRTADGIATLRIDGLDPLDIAEPFYEAALTLCQRASGLILDLRLNSGGDPASVAYLAGALLGPSPVSLSRLQGNDGVIEWASVDLPRSMCLAPTAPAAVLIGPATFSSGEALAYHLQARGRVRVFGERSPGGADHVTPVVLTSRVRAHLPIAAVIDTKTGVSWEGVGVVPDEPTTAADAPERALRWLRSALGSP